MKKLVLGIFIGLGLITPGVSCASMAICFNVYDDFLDVTSKFYQLKTLKRQAFLIIGMLLGIVMMLLLMSSFYQRGQYLINGIFMGIVIIGTITYRKRIENNCLKNPLSFMLLGILLMVLFELIICSLDFDVSFSYIRIFLVGFIASVAFVFPGISGGMILLSFGIYFEMIEHVKAFCSFLASFDFNYFNSVKIVLVFMVSIISGIILFSKIFKKKLQKANVHIKNFLLGVMIGSIFLMFVETNNFFSSLTKTLQYASGIIIGIFLQKILNYYSSKGASINIE